MLDPRFKSVKLIDLFIYHEHMVAIVEGYDKVSLFPLFLKSHHH
jgi:hypothetical protein